MTTKQVIYDMAKRQGYEGGVPRTTTEAINILADMLAGEDVEEGGTIKGALQVLAPYVNADGGGEGGGGEGGGSEPDNGDRTDPIRFFDYDGRLVASYTDVPSELPEVPTHDKLTNGAWNYTLDQVAKQFVATGTCDVGANYDTVSGKTEFDVKLDSAHLKPLLGVAVNGTATVDWGDGSTETVTGTSLDNRKYVQHVYAQAGEYTISVDGPIGFSGESDVPSILLSASSLYRKNCMEYSNSVTAVRLGASVTSIGNGAFINCHAMQSVTIPSSVTSIGDSAFAECHSLRSIAIPSGIVSVGVGAIKNCYSLQMVAIPSGITKIDKQTSSGCYALQSFTIPAGTITIADSAFKSCNSLRRIIIPSSVTSIGAYAFQGSYGTYELHLKPATPPTLATNNVFSILTGTIIYVPQGCLEAYQTASNWSNYKDYMQEEA